MDFFFGMHQEYFEGVLQLRNPTKEIIAFVEKELINNNIHIAKKLPVADGFDYYASSQRFLQNLGKKLKQKFVGELKVSPRIFTRDNFTSKDVFRVNVFFRAINYRIGETIDFRGEKYKITSIGRKVTARHIATGKRRMFTSEELG